MSWTFSLASDVYGSLFYALGCFFFFFPFFFSPPFPLLHPDPPLMSVYNRYAGTIFFLLVFLFSPFPLLSVLCVVFVFS